MRVVHITSAHPRDDVRIFLKECKSLANNGHEVSLLVADGLGNQTIGQISVIDVGRPRGRFQRMLQIPRRLLQTATALKADICHLHDPELLTIALQLQRNGCKVIFDAHEDVPKQILAKHYLHPWVRKIISYAFSAYEHHICARLNGVIAATPTIREKFRDISRQVIDVNNFPILGELESSGRRSSTGNEICYIGGIAAIRGIREIIQASALSSNDKLQLNLVGTFIEPDVETEVRASTAWSRVKSWGQQDRAGVRQVLSRSSIGLVTLHPTPNYLDSLPIKMFEYMAAGIPVIASDFPLWRSIIETADCGLCVNPLDPVAIANAIDKLLSNPAWATQLGQNGHRAVQEKFNWNLEEQKLIDFYATLKRETT